MSYNNPIPCRNCEGLIYWDKESGDKRPYDYETEEYHRCMGFQSAPQKPAASKVKPIQCKNGCGFTLYYDTKEGYYREGSPVGKKHFPCPNWDKRPTGQQQQTTTQVHTIPPAAEGTHILKTNLEETQPKHMTFDELANLIKEQNTILQGIAAQLQKIADNQDVANRYARVTKDILQEYKDEVIDSINSKPKLTFENGKIQEEEGTEDIYDEIADQDDTTESVEGDIRGFKPSDSGSKNVRSDI